MCYRLRKNNGEIEKSKHFLSYNTNCIHNKKKWDNLKAIGKLVEGEEVDKVIERLKGITCGFKQTSCGDQLSKALEEAKTKVN